MDRVTNVLVAEVPRTFESTQEEDCCSGSKAKNDAQQGRFIDDVFVTEFLLLYYMKFVVGIQISEKSTLSEWATNGIQDKDGYNQ